MEKMPRADKVEEAVTRRKSFKLQPGPRKSIKTMIKEAQKE